MTTHRSTLSPGYRVFRQLGFGFFRLRVQGLERIPTEGAAIVAGNHPSVLDGIVLPLSALLSLTANPSLEPVPATIPQTRRAP